MKTKNLVGIASLIVLVAVSVGLYLNNRGGFQAAIFYYDNNANKVKDTIYVSESSKAEGWSIFYKDIESKKFVFSCREIQDMMDGKKIKKDSDGIIADNKYIFTFNVKDEQLLVGYSFNGVKDKRILPVRVKDNEDLSDLVEGYYDKCSNN